LPSPAPPPVSSACAAESGIGFSSPCPACSYPSGSTRLPASGFFVRKGFLFPSSPESSPLRRRSSYCLTPHPPSRAWSEAAIDEHKAIGPELCKVSTPNQLFWIVTSCSESATKANAAKEGCGKIAS